MSWLLHGAMALSGLVVLVLGLCGRRINDHPLCRRCGADLLDRPSQDCCPACGHRLRAGRQCMGARHHRPIMTSVGVLLLLISAGATGFRGGLLTAPWEWLKVLPARAVLQLVHREDEPTESAAIQELLTRLQNDEIPAPTLPRIVEAALQAQADATRPWNDLWPQFIESAWTKGLLTEEQQRRYGRLGFRPRFIMPGESSRYGIVRCYLAVQPMRVGRNISMTAVVEEMRIGDESVSLEGTLERHEPFWGGLRDQGVARHSQLSFVERRSTKPAALKQGEHAVQCVWRVRYALAGTHVEELIEFTGFTYVCDRGYERIRYSSGDGPTLAELFALSVRPNPPVAEFRGASAWVRGTIYWGVDLFGAYEVYWRASGREVKVGEFTLADETRSSYMPASYGSALPDDFRPQAVEVVLRPVPRTGRQRKYLQDPPRMNYDVELLEIVLPMERVRYQEMRFR
jgi:hypothetical protein